MIVVREILPESEAGAAATADAQRSLTLPFQKRRLSRQRARLDDGEDVALFLPRGTVLREGSVLRSDDRQLVRVRAGAELVSRVFSDDPLLLTRAAYHLGNRHVSVQLGSGHLAYPHDHVLDDLVRGLGLRLTIMEAPFEPESGAYGGHDGHAHHEHEHFALHEHSLKEYELSDSDAETVP